MCGSSRRQVLLAGAAAPLLVRLPRAVSAVALGGVEVQPRSAWGADLMPKGPLAQEAAGDVRFLLVHHTASSNSYSEAGVVGLLRGFYGFHTGEKGWPDIAYNFLVDRFGRVWEGRTGSLDGPVKVDATGGSQGFAQLACFIGDHTTEPPTGPALDAMGKLLGALAARYGIDPQPGTRVSFVSRGSNLHPAGKQVTTATITGHRDMSKTSCPGDACFRIIPSRLVPAAVVAAGVRPATATKPPARAPVTAPAGSPAAIPAEPTPAEPTAAAPVAPPATAPEDTLLAANPAGLPPDTTPPPTVAPPTFPGAATSSPRSGVPVVTGVAAAGVTAAAAFLALVLRRRASTGESEHWEHARRLEEVDGPAGPPGSRGGPGA